ncbi:ATP-binding protein [uncultured Comamonas sp.]|uniref:YobI family P-loop NTPase n=1 Tax=uncultured Comamonas sp. TaxID=114710 RepID=UPI0025F9B00F|nr:ATP-binding protein [uncultured Comamonas sp.]
MIKNITAITRWIILRLNNILSWMESKDRSLDIKNKFIDLAPTDQADKAGVYCEAIHFATNNKKVTNIALTGPYGSGKSSIIQSFLKTYRRPALHISLAAFIPDADSKGGKIGRQEIERSILQQMLYGADANRLPLSRFKRIQSPSIWSSLKSLYITAGVLSLWYTYSIREWIFTKNYFKPLVLSNAIDLAACVFAVIFLWVTLHHFYVASFGLSLKSISLKDVEIKPAYDDQTSILNRHLDEIIYFFQSTKYDLVIVEDLDRFNEPDIFVTLREINSLVNENSGVKRTIRFLYALRDDMFISTDRTKFFEFIIPVIPIINTSNSIDMVLAHGKRLELDKRLDRQFLREVSRYLNDLRLIQNIFNEYSVYVANLETDGEILLNANKLLAILIYKNVYPRDFEQLHRGAGNIAELLNRNDELIQKGEDRYRNDIELLENRLEIAERQTPADLTELRKIYAMSLLEKLHGATHHVSLDRGTWISVTELANHDSFEAIIGASRLYVLIQNQGQTMIDLSTWQSDVAPKKSYLQRKEEIENKTADSKNKILQKIHELRSKIATLRMTKLNELLRLNAESVEDIFKRFDENGELARFLILEGHLDDTYYQYTSLFHSGRLSPNDNKFLIQIRAFITPEPNFPLDNPKEVIAAMRDEDFRQSYVLNVKIVDTLLNEQKAYSNQASHLIDFISSEFERCEDFLDSYYTTGRETAALLYRLRNSWKEMLPTAISSPNNVTHVTQLIVNLPVISLEDLAKCNETLSTFVSDNLQEILASFPQIAPERLECLNFKIKNLGAIKDHSAIVRQMFEKGLYELTNANIEYIYQDILGQSDIHSLREKNFTTIRALNNKSLTKRIENDINHYLHDILLKLDDNSEEDASAILEILRLNINSEENLQSFLERQRNQLATLEGVPETLYEMLFRTKVIEASWENCHGFINTEAFVEDALIGYLDQDDVRTAILQIPLPNGPERQELGEFLFSSISLSDDSYREYMHVIPYKFDIFPEKAELSKLQILVSEQKIELTKENLQFLSNFIDLQVLFVASNINSYIDDPDALALDDKFRESLLRTNISTSDKQKVVLLMDMKAIVNLPERAALIGPIINSIDEELPQIDANIAKSVIINSHPDETKISLFNRYHSVFSDDEVREVLAALPEPFSEIKIGFNRPRLENTPVNIHFLTWLDSRNIISSWSESSFLFENKLIVNLYRTRGS